MSSERARLATGFIASSPLEGVQRSGTCCEAASRRAGHAPDAPGLRAPLVALPC